MLQKNGNTLISLADSRLCEQGNTRARYPAIKQMVENFMWSQKDIGGVSGTIKWKLQCKCNVGSWLPGASPCGVVGVY